MSYFLSGFKRFLNTTLGVGRKEGERTTEDRKQRTFYGRVCQRAEMVSENLFWKTSMIFCFPFDNWAGTV